MSIYSRCGGDYRKVQCIFSRWSVFHHSWETDQAEEQARLSLQQRAWQSTAPSKLSSECEVYRELEYNSRDFKRK